jgi:hypothetical protein
MVTMAGLALLGGRNLNEGFQNVAQTAPAGMVAKSGMQQFMLAQQERDRERQEQEARRNAMNQVIQNWSGLTPEQRQLFTAQPELFGQYAIGTMTPEKPTDDLREYNFAKSQGFTGTFQDWQLAMKKAGATNVSVDSVGTIPQGYELFEDPTTGAKQMRPIPGGPADTSKSDRAVIEQRKLKGDIVVQDIDRALGTIERIPNATTGIGGTILKNVPGSGAANVSALIDSVRANVGFEQLQAMRQASPTGGALGAVSERENALLQSVLGSLEQSQSYEQLVFNLKRLKNVYLDIVHGPGQGPPREPLDAGVAEGGPAAGEVVDWQTYFGQ